MHRQTVQAQVQMPAPSSAPKPNILVIFGDDVPEPVLKGRTIGPQAPAPGLGKPTKAVDGRQLVSLIGEAARGNIHRIAFPIDQRSAGAPTSGHGAVRKAHRSLESM